MIKILMDKIDEAAMAWIKSCLNESKYYPMAADAYKAGYIQALIDSAKK